MAIGYSRQCNPIEKKRCSTEDIEVAKSKNIIDVANSLGYTVKKAGYEYYLKEHDSLKLNMEKNVWKRYSNNQAGGPIQLVIELNSMINSMSDENQQFVEAVLFLSGKEYIPKYNRETYSNNSQPKSFVLPNKSENNKRIVAYLIKTRELEPEVVYRAIRKGVLYQDERNNCVFVGKDNEGKARYATLRGTNSVANNGRGFKQDIAGSSKGYGFILEGQSLQKVFVTESPIDALSHASIYKLINKDWEGDTRLSLGGVSSNALIQYLKDHDEVENIVLCLDNDKAGQEATQRIKEELKELNKEYKIGTQNLCSSSISKDLNDELKILRSKLSMMVIEKDCKSETNEQRNLEEDECDHQP